MLIQMRVARPVTDLARTTRMYCVGLSLAVLGGFEDHDGFDGVMLGIEGHPYHLEFTFCHTHPVKPTPTPEDLLVFYLPDPDDWERQCRLMISAGFQRVVSLNPYWEVRGRTFEDADGYRVVIQRASWPA